MSDWKIKKANITGGKDKDLLDGAEIRLSEDGKSYELRIVAATTPGNSLPEPSFQFPAFDFADYTWNIGVSTVSATEITGTWRNSDPQITEGETGDFTAQAGQGADEGEEDASAASA